MFSASDVKDLREKTGAGRSGGKAQQIRADKDRKTPANCCVAAVCGRFY